VAARFEVLDEDANAQLLNELTLQVLLEGAIRPDGARQLTPPSSPQPISLSRK
jgi:hypothetical protein